MNFEDEPYVRLYPRQTLTSKLLGMEGRVVMRMMLDQFDESGVFEIRGDAATCISAVTELAIELVRTGLERLISTETWVVNARAVVWPTYDHAQHCQRSDRMRQQESRRARAARALNGSPAVTDVTPDAAPVTLVTTQCDKSHSPYPPSPPYPPSAPLASTQSERGARAPDGSTPEVPGLVVVGATPKHPGPLQPSRREQELTAKAEALTAGSLPRREYTPGWTPGKSNQARGHELGLTDDEIWARWETCKDKHYPSDFRSDVKQFNRELAFAAQDKQAHKFKSQRERDAFEMPGRERRQA